MSTNGDKLDNSFNKFGLISFTSVTKINSFIDFLSKGLVAGTKCNVCSKVFFPPRADCCYCLSSDFNWFILNGVGKLITYTTLNFAPKGFENDLPYSLGILDFQKYKIFGKIDDTLDVSTLKIEMEMKILVKSIGEQRFSYVFQKI